MTWYKFYVILLLSLILSGCGSATGFLLWSKTAVDGVLMLNDKPTTTEMILNKSTGKDCRFLNIINGKEICEDGHGKDNRKVE